MMIFLIQKVYNKIYHKFLLFSNLDIEEMIFKKADKLIEEEKKIEIYVNKNAIEHNLLEDKIGLVRRKMNEIWLSNETYIEKREKIYNLIVEANLSTSISRNLSKTFLKRFEDRANKDKNEKKNKNMANHQAQYESIPRISGIYYNTGLKNFNRDTKLIIDDMTKKKNNTIFFDLENRYNVKKDIMENLKKNIPDSFIKQCGFRKIKYIENNNENFDNENNNDNKIENKSLRMETKINQSEVSDDGKEKNEVNRPILNTNMETVNFVQRKSVAKFQKE